ncbi:MULTISPECIES: hypothetical protein [Xanthomonas]|uniref:hypothetical protein n=1 Tax=Xanthomonas TaxID=338 RepID=UPI0003B017B8|nr:MULTISPECIES: hypothetical protein [Xanthomonas]ATS64259.1 hypothetical protein XcfCFBP4885P_13210 [Xanthomonas citri pv. phaseoli var. fuscans]ATS70676.1 hypothetical protein XcfCFBP6166P_02970 [Xanthomonas citri pv. phaseoli var. fuscans]ATS79635.1 hypothetical protein XcfCFBP7767P_06840 [Xanthomonas citri pv. phaseoli var. fuscans]KGP21966.1 hypothetical protein NY65_20460 [Xanthomonas phaseoli pv. phaseoli]KGP22759.1 hypothetical protein NY68_19100 [Xanthomonas citri pv. fuscans]
MRNARLAVVGMLIVFLAGCSGGGPSKDQRQRAFLQYMKEEGSDNAKIRDFESSKCTKSESAPAYACDVSAKVQAAEHDFGNELDGIYTFAEVGGNWKVTGRIR